MHHQGVHIILKIETSESVEFSPCVKDTLIFHKTKPRDAVETIFNARVFH